jgi:hypothetical protein
MFAPDKFPPVGGKNAGLERQFTFYETRPRSEGNLAAALKLVE